MEIVIYSEMVSELSVGSHVFGSAPIFQTIYWGWFPGEPGWFDCVLLAGLDGCSCNGYIAYKQVQGFL